MSPDDSRHGTYAGAIAHAKTDTPECGPCTRARRREQSRWAKLRGLGYNNYRDAHPVRQHIDNLIENGMTYGSIAERAGVSPTTVEDVGRVFDRIHYTTADALSGVTLEPHPQGMVPAYGTLRRLQALAAIGWSQTAIAAAAKEAGVPLTLSAIRNIMRGIESRVRVRSRDAVATMYDQLSMTTPPPSRAVSLAVAVARREGYAPPLAWNDIDDPAEQPTDWQYVPANRRTQVAEMAERGDNLTNVCRALHLSVNSFHQWCTNNKMRDTYRILAAREGDWNSSGRIGRDGVAA